MMQYLPAVPWPPNPNRAPCDSTYGRSRPNLTWCTSTRSARTMPPSSPTSTTHPAQKFGEIMNDLVEDWTMVIPFGHSVAS